MQTGKLWSDGKARWNGDIDQLVITPDFNDGVFVDQEAQRSADLQAVQASVMPKIQFIMRNYDLSEEEAQKWLQQIQDEQSPTPPDQEMDMLPGGEVNLRTRKQSRIGKIFQQMVILNM